MAARSIASLLVSFGMVSIPVKLYAATQASAGISFNLLHGACGSRLRQQYVCIKEDVVVERADMVKGYEFAKDQYVMFTPEELTALGEKATQTVEIDEFVPAESIDPIYYDKAHFLGPDRGGAMLYAPEVRTIEDVEIPEAPVRDAELTLAQQLIAQISSPTFDPTKYEDDVKKRIETAIEQKLEGQEIAVSPSVPEAGGQVIDLMEAL